MRPHRSLARSGAILTSAVLVAGLAVAVSPAATAASAGTLTIEPASGISQEVSTFVTSGQCPSGSTVRIKVWGGSGDGAVIPDALTINSPKVMTSPRTADGVYTAEGGMRITAPVTWAAWATNGTPILTQLNGAYTVRAWCSTGEWFDGTITWSGGALDTATYVQGSTPTSTAPGAPTGATATGGDGRATVAWAAPASDGGAAISGYTVTAAPGGSTCSTAGALTCDVLGLVNGTTYTFSVTATNSVGTGPAGAASAGVLVAGLPAAPTGVIATGGQDTVSAVRWTAPVNTGGLPIASYTVTSFSAGRPVRSCTTAALTCAVPGLINGYGYTFTVTATTAKGTSAASASSAAVVPLGFMRKASTKTITIKGTPRVGYTVARFIPTYTFFSSSGSKYSGITYTYQWYRGTTKISKATATRYKLTRLDKGKRISVRVTAKKFGFRPLTVKSTTITVK